MFRGILHGLVVVTGFACAACGSGEPRRVLLIGLDGATPRVVDQGIADGRLPHLATIAREGVSGTLRSHNVLLSPRIWTSVATGKDVNKHGISGWVYRDEAGTLRLYKSVHRTANALWNIASDAGLRVGVVNWLNTYPPEVIDGAMISDFAIPGERESRHDLGEMFVKAISKGTQTTLPSDRSTQGTTHPAEWAQKLATLASAHTEEPFSGFHAEDVLSRAYATDRLVAQLAIELDRQLRLDVLMVYMPGIDRVSHFLWGAFEPPEIYPEAKRFAPEEREAAARALWSYYEAVDRLVGTLVERMEPRDLVLILSDHGFEAMTSDEFPITGGHDSEAARRGVIFARGQGIPASGAPGEVSVNDITPTILAWLGLPLAEDMDGRPAPFLDFEPVESVATHDAPIQYMDHAAEEIEDAIIEQLRGLGYVED
jgi:predicted AlkP superfamily phosphohydrolase/phosphomutase